MFHLSTWGGFYQLLVLFLKWKSTLSFHRLMGTPAPPQAEPNTWDQLCFQPLAESGLCGQNAWVRPPTLSVGVWTGAAAMESSMEVPQNARDRVAIGSRMAQMIIWPQCGRPWVRSLVREDPLEKGMATHSSILAWRIPWTQEPGRPHPMGLQTVGHDWATNIFTFTLWNGNPPPGHISKQNYNSKRYMHFQRSLLYYAAIKKNEIIPFAAIWRDLEMVLLNEVRKRKTNITYHLYVESKVWQKLTYLWNRNRLTDRE